jgi:hypothetical protein
MEYLLFTAQGAVKLTSALHHLSSITQTMAYRRKAALSSRADSEQDNHAVQPAMPKPTAASSGHTVQPKPTTMPLDKWCPTLVYTDLTSCEAAASSVPDHDHAVQPKPRPSKATSMATIIKLESDDEHGPICPEAEPDNDDSSADDYGPQGVWADNDDSAGGYVPTSEAASSDPDGHAVQPAMPKSTAASSVPDDHDHAVKPKPKVFLMPKSQRASSVPDHDHAVQPKPRAVFKLPKSRAASSVPDHDHAVKPEPKTMPKSKAASSVPDHDHAVQPKPKVMPKSKAASSVPDHDHAVQPEPKFWFQIGAEIKEESESGTEIKEEMESETEIKEEMESEEVQPEVQSETDNKEQATVVEIYAMTLDVDIMDVYKNVMKRVRERGSIMAHTVVAQAVFVKMRTPCQAKRVMFRTDKVHLAQPQGIELR